MKKKVKDEPLLNDFGHGVYTRARADLEKNGLFHDVDDDLLRAYAMEVQAYYLLYAQVQREGVSVDTGTGSVKPNPAVGRMGDALRQTSTLARLLGIGAAARKQIGVEGRRETKSAVVGMLKIAKCPNTKHSYHPCKAATCPRISGSS